MKRKVIIIILSLVCALLCTFALAACNNKNKPDGGDAVKVGGTYYYCENDVIDDQIYITFQNGKWTDDEDETGEYSVSDNNIALYVDLAGEKEEFAVGTVSGNDITLNIMGADVVYRKGEDIGNKPKEKTLKYALSEDRTSYTVKGIGGLTGDIEIPDEYKKKPVTEIAENAFANCNEITNVVIGNNVVNLGKKAFYNCANLVSASLGECVNKLAESVFEGCKQLEKVTVSASVKKFEYDAFKDCGKLVDIYFTGTAIDWAAIDFAYAIGYEESITTATPFYATYLTSTGMQEVYRKLYIDDELLTSADLSEATAVNPLCFYRYKDLESVTIGGTAEQIGEYAFYGCKSLASVQFNGNSLKTIGKHAFDGYCTVNSVSLPDSVNRIGKFAFNNCEQLLSVNTGNGASYIGEGAFMGCAALSSLTLGSSVAEICETAFYGCNALTAVNIPSSAIFIGAEAFMYSGLTSATFDNTSGWQVLQGKKYVAVENLGDTANAAELLKTSILSNGYSDYDWEKTTLKYTLSGDGSYYTVSNDGTACRSEIVIPETYNDKPVKALADKAFAGCRNLVSITIPDSISIVGGGVFYDCSNLTTVSLSKNITELPTYDEIYGGGFFEKCSNLTNVIIPDGVKSIGSYAFNGCRSLTHVTIPDGVTSIGSFTFNYCINITSIAIPSSVTSIGKSVFSSCINITSITIPNSVTSIDEGAFIDCIGLTSIIYIGDIKGWCSIKGLEWLIPFGSSNKHLIIDGKVIKGELIIPNSVTNIESCVFAFCNDLTSVTIGNGVTSIGDNAFYSCSNITSMIIPNSVTSIGSQAFLYCEGLSSITFKGTKEQWEAIKKGSGWDNDTGDYTIYCTDGDIAKS